MIHDMTGRRAVHMLLAVGTTLNILSIEQMTCGQAYAVE
jgi:hypothetical protein